MSNQFKLGCDPEFFLFNKETGCIESAHDLVPGSKGIPYKLTYGGVLSDGVAVEFNIDPAESAEVFEININHTLKEIRALVPAKYKFEYKSTAVFKGDYWKDLPNTAKEIGCDPDFNAFTGNRASRSPKDGIRHAGGHIHVGWRDPTDITPSHLWDAKYICRQMYYSFARLFNTFQKEDYERQYDVPKSVFRPKPYGAEFRGLSNLWLGYPKLYSYIFNTCKKAYERTLEGLELNELYQYSYLNDGYFDYKSYHAKALKKLGMEDIPSDWRTHGQSVS